MGPIFSENNYCFSVESVVKCLWRSEMDVIWIDFDEEKLADALALIWEDSHVD